MNLIDFLICIMFYKKEGFFFWLEIGPTKNKPTNPAFLGMPTHLVGWEVHLWVCPSIHPSYNSGKIQKQGACNANVYQKL